MGVCGVCVCVCVRQVRGQRVVCVCDRSGVSVWCVTGQGSACGVCVCVTGQGSACGVCVCV